MGYAAPRLLALTGTNDTEPDSSWWAVRFPQCSTTQCNLKMAREASASFFMKLNLPVHVAPDFALPADAWDKPMPFIYPHVNKV